jgi:hypothetical protein
VLTLASAFDPVGGVKVNKSTYDGKKNFLKNINAYILGRVSQLRMYSAIRFYIAE